MSNYDSLEKIFKENRKDFDIEKLTDGHEERFKEKLLNFEVRQKKENVINWKYIAIAASIAFVLMSVVSIYNYGKNNAILALVKSDRNMYRQDMVLSMMESQSPSKRLKAVNYIEEYSDPDDEIISALIKTLSRDDNSNVRLSTALGLYKFAYRKDVRKALAEALIYEKDPNVQLELINILVAIKDKSAIEPMKKMLGKKDVHDFVKDQIERGITEINIKKI